MKRRQMLTAGLFGMTGWVAARLGGEPATATTHLTLFTARPGSVYERAGRALQTVLQPQGFTITLKESPGSMFNLEQLAQGRGDLAFAQKDAFILFKNLGPKQQALAENLTVIGPVNQELVHILTRPGVRSLQDLSGKKIGVGPEDSGTYVSALLMLQMADLDVTREQLLTGEIRQQVQDWLAGKLDVLFVTSGLGTPVLKAIPAKAKIQLLSVGQAALDQGKAVFPEAAALYRPMPVPARTYPWQPQAVTALATYSCLFARRSLAEPVVYRLAQTLSQQQAVLHRADPFWALFTLDQRQNPFMTGLNYHPGVRQYLREIQPR